MIDFVTFRKSGTWCAVDGKPLAESSSLWKAALYKKHGTSEVERPRLPFMMDPGVKKRGVGGWR
jgi:hypothetical protein